MVIGGADRVPIVVPGMLWWSGRCLTWYAWRACTARTHYETVYLARSSLVPVLLSSLSFYLIEALIAIRISVFP